MKKNLPLLIIVFTFFTHCNNLKKEKIDVSGALLKVDSCGLSYKGEKLELGVPISEWEKVLGKPSRDTDLAFVWDNVGIAIDDWQNKDGMVSSVYIFFLNLESPEANEQMLNHARDWESGEHVIARIMKEDKIGMSEELRQKEKRINIDNQLFRQSSIYPLKVYQGVVNLQGYPVQSGMKVETINKYRKNIPEKYTSFGYIDDDIDGVNNSGVTTKTFGGDYRAPGYECKDGRLQYFELTYTATGSLEYLKIGYESKEEYENRKEFRE